MEFFTNSATPSCHFFSSGNSVRMIARTTLGGAAGARDVISRNGENDVLINGTSITGKQLLGNFIGTDVSGADALGNAGNGISVFTGSSLNQIGAGNTIAFNGGDGVFINFGSGNRITRNSIFSNFLLGIDLNEANGANNAQSCPNLTSAVLNATHTSITIQGSILGQVGKSFTIEFFANAPGDPEGKRFLGALTVSSNNAGSHPVATQNFTAGFFTIGVSERDLITATATDSLGNTSEFSDARVVR